MTGWVRRFQRALRLGWAVIASFGYWIHRIANPNLLGDSPCANETCLEYKDNQKVTWISWRRSHRARGYHSQLLFLDISTLQAYIMSITGFMSHSSWMISDDVALTSGSQVNIFRINLRNISFSSPGGIFVTKSSKEVLGMGGSDIQLPVVTGCQIHLVQSSDYGLSIGNRSEI